MGSLFLSVICEAEELEGVGAKIGDDPIFVIKAVEELVDGVEVVAVTGSAALVVTVLASALSVNLESVNPTFISFHP